MKYEFYAQYSLFRQMDFAQKAVDYLTGAIKQPPKALGDLEDVTDPSARIQLLAQAILTPYKNYARIGGGSRGKPAGLLHAIKSKSLDQFFKLQYSNFLEPLKLNPTIPDIAIFPESAWAINFTFKLQKPYISKDDTDFYVIDNPVRKEWVFNVPYVAPSQWKGSLRAMVTREMVEWWSDLKGNKQDTDENRKKFVDRRIQLTRLFGNEKDVALDNKKLDAYLDKKGGEDLARDYRKQLELMTGTGFFAGRLRFYPTYFTQIGLEVINPHDREKGSGQPIYFESVPVGSEGEFTLLYIPADRVGIAEAGVCSYIAEDLRVIADGLHDMFTVYGFGGKTSSGFGVAEESFCSEGQLMIKAQDPEKETMEKPPSEPEEPEIVRTFRQQYPGEEFSEKPKLWRKTHHASSSDQEKYKKAREAYRQYQQAISDYRAALAEEKRAKAQPVKLMTRRKFSSFSELVEKVTALAKAWRQ
jgi:CRISPR-associated protein Cmr2